MSINVTFYKLNLLCQFCSRVAEEKNKLLEELIDNAPDPIVSMRRFRMLQNINQYEQQIIKKIYEFDTDDVRDLTNIRILLIGLNAIVHRSA